MIIRQYQNSDQAALLEMLRLNTPVYFAPEEEADFITYLDLHATNYFVVELDNQLVACGGFNASEVAGEMKIAWDIVHPDFQGKGIGGRLLNFRIEQIQKIETVKTIVVRTSQKADLFYAKHGFETKKIAKDYWAKGFDLHQMERLVYLA
ncbi:MAG: GNAT family N-acetyltransferase [Bacteroidia bacterium]